MQFLLWLNRFFKARPHPFNEKPEQKLSYHNFEYHSAPLVFEPFENILGTKFWVKKDIIDFACGAGGKSLWLKEQGAKSVLGIDMSSVLIDQAKIESKDTSDIAFRIEDVSHTSESDASYDYVIANDIMEHVQNPRQTLLEAHRILRKGGYICINFEPYYHFLGHHMWDVIHIPWAHVFFSESQRIKAYKELVKNLPDGAERIAFRIDTDPDGTEYIGYLNHMTLSHFRSILKTQNQLWSIKHYEIETFEKPHLKILGRIPYLQEFLCKKALIVLEKRG